LLYVSWLPPFLEEILKAFLLPPVQAETDSKSGHGLLYSFQRENGLSSGVSSTEITGLLKAWSSGNEAALARLAEQVYPELRLMARRYMKNERQGNTLQTTGLVHEVYLRLVDVTKVEWQERAQFFAMAAQMMRRILVDAARARGADKRGGRAVKVNLDETAALSRMPNRSVLAVDEALTAFSQVAPRQAKVVELRYFGGLSEEEIVATLKISPRTVRRDWDLAKAWLSRELGHRIKQPQAHDPGEFPAD
jgi:RNA polymerase sigma factor (TIGR02999 family)